MRALVAGWFSFVGMGATAGDLLARDVVCEWLEKAGVSYDVATAPPFTGGVTWQRANPAEYSDVIFVCGPFGNGEPIIGFLRHFEGRRLIGIDLSMLQPLGEWNPFHILLERDSSERTRPDLAFLADFGPVPVIGRILVHPQSEYGGRGRHEQVHQCINDVLAQVEAAVIPIDTRLDVNEGGLRTPGEIATLISRMDLVLTTRLHGMVLALKQGVPAVVVDPIEGGAKISRQAETIGWPVVLSSDDCNESTLKCAYDYCLTQDARARARAVARRAKTILEESRSEFVAFLSDV